MTYFACFLAGLVFGQVVFLGILMLLERKDH